MTTLPPEGQNPEAPGGQPLGDPAAPQAPVPPQAPPAPQAPQYQQYQQPAGGQVPPGGGYQQGYAQQPVADPVSNITLNYWLSVFFTWIPALIFFLIEKDKGNRQAYDYHRDNLNFSLLRVGAGVATYILAFVFLFIPYVGVLLSTVLWLANIALFVFHIVAAAKAPAAFRAGEKPPFMFNIPLIK